jgi:hypothetical protein
VNHQEIPIWPETTVELLSSTLIKYRVDVSPDQVVQFYRTEMPLRGWSTDRHPLIERQRAVLSFARAGRVINCIIEQDHRQRTRVILALQPTWSSPIGHEVNGGTALAPSST